jgi:hypothetical protein
MADNVYKWLLDATAGAPLPFVLTLLAATFVVVKAATVSLLANVPLPNVDI